MTERELENLIFDMRCEAVLKFKEGAYDKAWKILMDAWDLLPEPKYKQSESWFGDCYLLKKEYESAKNYYFDAYNYDYSNPYINMRLGECFLFLHNEAKTKEYLIRAYMMAGEDVFRGNEWLLGIIKNMVSP